MFEVLGAVSLICIQQPLLALVSLAITPLLSRLLRAVVVRSSAIIFRRQQVCGCADVGVRAGHTTPYVGSAGVLWASSQCTTRS